MRLMNTLPDESLLRSRSAGIADMFGLGQEDGTIDYSQGLPMAGIDDILADNTTMLGITAAGSVGYAMLTDPALGKTRNTDRAIFAGDALLNTAAAFYGFRTMLDVQSGTMLKIAGGVIGTLASMVAIGSVVGLVTSPATKRKISREGAASVKKAPTIVKAATQVIARSVKA